MSRYSQNPAVTYLRVSDNEVIARGGHLDSFSLIISDDTGRGLAAAIVDQLAEGTSAKQIHRVVSETHEVTVEEIEQFLGELYESGVALRIEQDRASIADWLAFARFGEIAVPAALYPLVVVGSGAAAMLAERLGELGLQAEHRSWSDLDQDDLSAFAIEDSRSDPRDPVNVAPQPESDAAEVTDPTETEAPTAAALSPRLVVLADSGSLQGLYDLNERAARGRVPVLYVQVTGVEYAVGPYVVPNATACFWEYERQRARSVFSYSEYAVLAAGALRGDRCQTVAVALHAVLAAATPFLVELALLGESSLAGQVVRGRATTAETSRHYVMRLPRCPVCLPLRPTIRNPLF